MRPVAGPPSTLQEQFGAIDIYLFDQLLRGRLPRGMRVLDAGCGNGRNLLYLLRNGYDVSATDRDPGAIGEVGRLAAAIAPHIPPSQFRVEPVEACSFPDACLRLRAQQRRPAFRQRRFSSSTGWWRRCGAC